MSWTKLDDGFDQHPKIAAVGPIAELLQIHGLIYCNRYMTDGFIPNEAIGRLLDQGWLESHLSNQDGYPIVTKFAEILVENEVWKRVDGGVQIIHFLEFQRSRAQVLAEREANAIRQGRHRTNAVTHGVSRRNAVSNGRPVPVPVSTENLNGSLAEPHVPAVSNTVTPAADVVAFYIEEVQRYGGLAVHKGAVAGQAKQLLQGGVPVELIKVAVTRMVEKARPASALRGLVDEINRERNGHTPPPRFESAGERRTRETEELFARGGWKP